MLEVVGARIHIPVCSLKTFLKKPKSQRLPLIGQTCPELYREILHIGITVSNCAGVIAPSVGLLGGGLLSLSLSRLAATTAEEAAQARANDMSDARSDGNTTTQILTLVSLFQKRHL